MINPGKERRALFGNLRAISNRIGVFLSKSNFTTEELVNFIIEVRSAYGKAKDSWVLLSNTSNLSSTELRTVLFEEIAPVPANPNQLFTAINQAWNNVRDDYKQNVFPLFNGVLYTNLQQGTELPDTVAVTLPSSFRTSLQQFKDAIDVITDV